MARPYRLQGENCFYHITSRGDDRKKIFISDFDYAKFLEYLLKAKEKYQFYLYAYALMPNHYHLLIETLQPNLSRIMQYINTSYTTYYNIKRGKCGHVFQGRYKSILVDQDSYFLELTRYIHLNPVRKKMVKNPNQYRWSSFKGYMDRKGDGYIDKEAIGKILNMKTVRYRQFAFDGIKKEDSPFENVYAGFLLGKTAFIKDKLQDLREHIENKEVAYKRDLQGSAEEEKIIHIVAKKYQRDAGELCSKKSRFLKERKIAIYLLRMCTGSTNKKIGELFGISPTAVIKAARNIERSMQTYKNTRKEIDGLISVFSA